MLDFLTQWKNRLKLLGKSTAEINAGSVPVPNEQALIDTATKINTVLNDGSMNKFGRICEVFNIKDQGTLVRLKSILESKDDNLAKAAQIQSLITGNTLEQNAPTPSSVSTSRSASPSDSNKGMGPT